MFELIACEIPSIKRSASHYQDEEPFDTDSPNSWKWSNFVAYWNLRYKEAFDTTMDHHRLHFKNRGRFKGMIEPTIEARGAETLKAMIDFVFDNYKSFPNWSLQIGMVCGSHYLSDDIFDKVCRMKEKEIKEASW